MRNNKRRAGDIGEIKRMTDFPISRLTLPLGVPYLLYPPSTLLADAVAAFVAKCGYAPVEYKLRPHVSLLMGPVERKDDR